VEGIKNLQQNTSVIRRTETKHQEKHWEKKQAATDIKSKTYGE